MSDGWTPADGPGDVAGQPQQDQPQQSLPPVYGQPGYGPAGYPQPGYPQPGYPPGYGMPAAPGFGSAPFGVPPRTHLAWARIAGFGGVLFNLIIGFPAGLVAIRYARQVRPRWEAGDLQGAASSSRKARKWAIASTVFDVLGVLLLVLIISSQATPDNYNNPAVVAASLKTQLQQRISDPSGQYYVAGLKVTSVVCTPAGVNTDHCVDHFSNGQSASETAVISDGGARYETH
jgi:hypothetical protein